MPTARRTEERQLTESELDELIFQMDWLLKDWMGRRSRNFPTKQAVRRAFERHEDQVLQYIERADGPGTPLPGEPWAAGIQATDC